MVGNTHRGCQTDQSLSPGNTCQCLAARTKKGLPRAASPLTSGGGRQQDLRTRPEWMGRLMREKAVLNAVLGIRIQQSKNNAPDTCVCVCIRFREAFLRNEGRELGTKEMKYLS